MCPNCTEKDGQLAAMRHILRILVEHDASGVRGKGQSSSVALRCPCCDKAENSEGVISHYLSCHFEQAKRYLSGTAGRDLLDWLAKLQDALRSYRTYHDAAITKNGLTDGYKTCECNLCRKAESVLDSIYRKTETKGESNGH